MTVIVLVSLISCVHLSLKHCSAILRLGLVTYRYRMDMRRKNECTEEILECLHEVHLYPISLFIFVGNQSCKSVLTECQEFTICDPVFFLLDSVAVKRTLLVAINTCPQPAIYIRTWCT